MIYEGPDIIGSSRLSDEQYVREAKIDLVPQVMSYEQKLLKRLR